MKTNTPHLYRLAFTTLTTVALTLLPLKTRAFDPPTQKIHGKNVATQTNPDFGRSVASNEKWIIVGEPGNDDSGEDSGVLHVFNAVTGDWLRKIKPSDPLVDGEFAVSVAISGDIAVCGRATFAGIGSAYVFNVATGQQLLKLTALNGHVGDYFGHRVAIDGGLILVGAPQGDGAAAGTGAAYVFDAKTGQQRARLQHDATVEQLGYSVALSGTRALVGAPPQGNVNGSAYVYDLRVLAAVMTPITRIQGITDTFGQAVALDGNMAWVADGIVRGYDLSAALPLLQDASITLESPTSGYNICIHSHTLLIGHTAGLGNDWLSGIAYLADARTGEHLHTFKAVDGATSDDYGRSVSLCNGTAVIGATGVETNSTEDAGAAYIYRNVAKSLPFTTKAAVKDSAPGTEEASYSLFGDAFINPYGEIAFTSTLKGKGAIATKNQGAWSSRGNSNGMFLQLRKGDAYPEKSVTIGAVAKPLFNQPEFGLVEATLTGVGISAANNRVLMVDDGTSIAPLLRTGDKPFGDTRIVASYGQVVQSNSAAFGQAVPIKLRLQTGIVNAANDSSIIGLSNNGSIFESVFEGNAAPGVPNNYGEFSRVGVTENTAVYSGALTGPAATNAGIFTFNSGGITSYIIAKGAAVPGINGAAFASFLGETTSDLGHVLFKATTTLVPNVTTSANNLGLWSNHNGVLALVARKGMDIPGYPGLKWLDFTQYWSLAPTVLKKQILFVAKVQGTGITAANDLGLWLLDESGNFTPLLREGDQLPDSMKGTISTIQHVAADSDSGQYAVLVGLSNSLPTHNQALLGSNTGYGNTTTFSGLRLPQLLLRKGWLTTNNVSAHTSISSIYLPTTSSDATGAGSKGLGQAINPNGNMVLRLTFSNGVSQIMSGKP
jgi:FG-GAP repeat